MCVILDIKAGATIPFADLKLACDINKHGYGIAVPDRGKLHIIRSIKQPNNPDEVARYIDDAKKHRVFVHLRHATVGEVIEENSHPFLLLNKSKHGVDVGLMHNGTLWEYKPAYNSSQSRLSDTYFFAKDYAGPLAERTIAFTGNKKLFSDQFFRDMICKAVGHSQSRLLFFDGWGNALKVNEKMGVQKPGYWASNEYSFNDQHERSSTRTPTTTNNYGTNYGPEYGTQSWDGYDWATGDDMPWTEVKPTKKETYVMADWEKQLDKETANDKKPPAHMNKTVFANISLAEEIRKVGEVIRNTMINPGASVLTKVDPPEARHLKVSRVSFAVQAGLKSIFELGRFTTQDLVELCQNYPEVAAQAVIDLLDVATTLKHRNEAQAKTIIETTGGKVSTAMEKSDAGAVSGAAL